MGEGREGGYHARDVAKKCGKALALEGGQCGYGDRYLRLEAARHSHAGTGESSRPRSRAAAQTAATLGVVGPKGGQAVAAACLLALRRPLPLLQLQGVEGGQHAGVGRVRGEGMGRLQGGRQEAGRRQLVVQRGLGGSQGWHWRAQRGAGPDAPVQLLLREPLPLLLLLLHLLVLQ